MQDAHEPGLEDFISCILTIVIILAMTALVIYAAWCMLSGFVRWC